MQSRPAEAFKARKTSSLAAALLPILTNQPWLVVLDGLERVLIAYNRYDASHIPDEDVSGQRKAQECIQPADSSLLRGLSEATRSKILISTRLMPATLTDSDGNNEKRVAHKVLEGLAAKDAEAMLRTTGIHGDSKRIRSYLDKNFGCHPLITGVVGGLVKHLTPAPGNFRSLARSSGGRKCLGPRN